jgi:hypothetical protein
LAHAQTPVLLTAFIFLASASPAQIPHQSTVPSIQLSHILSADRAEFVAHDKKVIMKKGEAADRWTLVELVPSQTTQHPAMRSSRTIPKSMAASFLSTRSASVWIFQNPRSQLGPIPGNCI